MSHGTVYLAGPIATLSYKGATHWREHAADILNSYEITAFSPMRWKEHLQDSLILDGGDTPDHPLCAHRAVCHRDLWDVERCDVTLVNLLGARAVSIGTVMEMALAYHLRKPVVVAIEASGNPHDGHPMLAQTFAYRTDTLQGALNIVQCLLVP